MFKVSIENDRIQYSHALKTYICLYKVVFHSNMLKIKHFISIKYERGRGKWCKEMLYRDLDHWTIALFSFDSVFFVCRYKHLDSGQVVRVRK